jgi:hypothetical protein
VGAGAADFEGAAGVWAVDFGGAAGVWTADFGGATGFADGGVTGLGGVAEGADAVRAGGAGASFAGPGSASWPAAPTGTSRAARPASTWL